MGLRGAISSLGAGLSLIVGAVLALTVVSGLVAFNGSLGVIERETPEVVRLPSAPPPLREQGDAPAAHRVELAAARERSRVRARRARTAAASRPGGRQQTAGEYAERTAPRAQATAAPAPVADAPVASPADPAPAAAPDAPAPVEQVTGVVEDVLEPVTGATEQIVDGLLAP